MVVSLKYIFLSTFGGQRSEGTVPHFLFFLHVPFATVYVVVCVLLLLSCQRNKIDGTIEEHAYDQLQLKSRWSEIIEKNRHEPAQSLACQKVVALARWYTGVGNGDDLRRCLEDSHDVLTSPTAALMMSDTYMRLNAVSMAQRSAFEAMVKMGDIKNCERPLRRLTETALITGQMELVMKYASLLEDFSTSREWARHMKQVALHPELISEEPVYKGMKEVYEKTEDDFFL